MNPHPSRFQISSRHNSRLKCARLLRHRDQRDSTGTFLIAGIGLLAAAQAAGAHIESAIVCPGLCQSRLGRELLNVLHEQDVPTLTVTPEVFATLSDDRAHGIAAIVHQQWHALPSVPAPDDLYVAVHAIQYPANLGTILRTADAVGGAGVILLDRSTDPYAPQSVRASRGAVCGQHLVRSSFAQFATWVQDCGVRVIGASPSGGIDYRDAEYARPLVLLMGCERSGLSPAHLALCDQVVRIPMRGHCDSLNLAVATSLMLYQAVAPPEASSGGGTH
jgi:TrmH family RNA methyltransferase